MVMVTHELKKVGTFGTDRQTRPGGRQSRSIKYLSGLAVCVRAGSFLSFFLSSLPLGLTGGGYFILA